MPRKIPATAYPLGPERDYYRALLNAIRQWFAELLQDLLSAPGIRRDALFDGVFDRARGRWAQLAAALLTVVQQIGSQVDRVVTRSFTRQMESQQPAILRQMTAMAVSLSAIPEVQGELESFARQNALLIKDIGEKAAREIEIAVIDAVAKGQQTRDLAKLIRGTLDTTKARAALIARDQVGKLNGNLNRVRMQSAGIDRYQWQTMQDRRVRPKHVARNGQTFSWSEPPSDGHPGQPVACRCTPLPIFD